MIRRKISCTVEKKISLLSFQFEFRDFDKRKIFASGLKEPTRGLVNLRANLGLLNQGQHKKFIGRTQPG